MGQNSECDETFMMILLEYQFNLYGVRTPRFYIANGERKKKTELLINNECVETEVFNLLQKKNPEPDEILLLFCNTQTV